MFKQPVQITARPASNGYIVGWNDPNQAAGKANLTLVAADLSALKTLLHTQVDTLTEQVAVVPAAKGATGGIVTGAVPIVQPTT